MHLSCDEVKGRQMRSKGRRLHAKAGNWRGGRRTLAVGFSTLALLSFGLVGVFVESAGATVTPPSTVNELVSLTGSPSNASCPSGITPTVGSYTNLVSAIAAASSGSTIYVCAGAYDLSNTSTYSSDEDVVVSKSLTIDGTDWNSPYSGSDTDASVNSSTQSVFENGAGILVEAGHVTIQGFTFYENNDNNGTPDCFAGTASYACSNSIDVQSNVDRSGPGNQGESNVTVDDNLFADTGGSNYQNGDVHFGLGQDGSPTDVNSLDTGDVVEDNVFYQGTGYQNNAVQISDTSGAVVDSNTVNYPTDDDTQISALWFPGFDQATQVESNTLNGGGLDSDLSTGINTTDAKSGIKFVDQDSQQSYGDGCTDQVISHNTISGFVYDISMASESYNPDASLCSIGPSDFTVSDNTLSGSRLYGIYISGSANSTISGNSATTTDTEGYSSLSYTSGDYDYYDNDSQPLSNTWTVNDGTGSAYPSSIGDSNPTTTTTVPATTTTVPATTTTVPATTTTVPATTTTVPATTTTVPATATTVPNTASTVTTSTSTDPTSSSAGSTTTSTGLTTVLAPIAAVTTSAVKPTTGNAVSTTIHCTGATCTGTLELTKTVTTRVQIGHTKKYRERTTVMDLGQTRYAVSAGQSRGFSVHLNATGLKFLRSSTARRYSCELVIRTLTSVHRQIVSFARP
jgi:parallel beta-helix repeat protein